LRKRWKCDLRSNKLPWSIAAVTAIDELRRSCTAGDASEPQEVARIMREDNLLGMQPERFVVTTNSNHKLEIYLNLAIV